MQEVTLEAPEASDVLGELHFHIQVFLVCCLCMLEVVEEDLQVELQEEG
jgi:hypothetical protein